MITFENFEFAVQDRIDAEGELVTRDIIIRETDSGLIIRFPLAGEHAEELAAALTKPVVTIAQKLPDNGSHA